MAKNRIVIVIIVIVLLFFGAYMAFHYQNSEKDLSNNEIEENSQKNTIATVNNSEGNNLVNGNEEQDSSNLLTAQSPHGFILTYDPSKLKFYTDRVSGFFAFCDATANLPDDITIVHKDMPTYGCLTISSLSPSQDFKNFSEKMLVDKFNKSIDGSSDQYYILKSKEKIKLGKIEFYKAIYWLGEKKGGYRYLGLLDDEKNRIISADYFYDDYSVRNERIIPIFENLLSTLQNVSEQ